MSPGNVLVKRAINHLYPLEIGGGGDSRIAEMHNLKDETEATAEQEIDPKSTEKGLSKRSSKRVMKKKREPIYLYENDPEYGSIGACAVKTDYQPGKWLTMFLILMIFSMIILPMVSIPTAYALSQMSVVPLKERAPDRQWHVYRIGVNEIQFHGRKHATDLHPYVHVRERESEDDFTLNEGDIVSIEQVDTIQPHTEKETMTPVTAIPTSEVQKRFSGFKCIMPTRGERFLVFTLSPNGEELDRIGYTDRKDTALAEGLKLVEGTGTKAEALKYTECGPSLSVIDIDRESSPKTTVTPRTPPKVGQPNVQQSPTEKSIKPTSQAEEMYEYTTTPASTNTESPLNHNDVSPGYIRAVKRGFTAGVKLHSSHPEVKARLLGNRKPKESSYFYCKTNSFTLWRTPGKDAICEQLPELLMNGEKTTLTVYSKHTQPELLKAFICAKKYERIDFYTNLLGDPWSNLTTEYLPITPDECRHMSTYKSCSEGTMTVKGRDFYATSKTLDFKFLGKFECFWRGMQNVEAKNCLLENIEIFVKRNTLTVSSPAYDMRHCKFKENHCYIKGMIIVWEAECGRKQNCEPCTYAPIGAFSGRAKPKSFLTDDHNLGLTFDATAKRTVGCDGKKLWIANEGFAISDVDYQRLEVSAKPSPRRRKREWATTEELAAGLTASEMNMMRTIEKVTNYQCAKGNPESTDPTIMARQMLHREDVMAKWVGPHLLKVYSCAPFPATQIRLRKTEGCFKYLPINYDLGEIRGVDAFLDTRLKVISETSPVADCRTNQLKYFESQDGLIEFDVTSGLSRIVLEEEIHKVPLGVGIKSEDLSIDNFHDLVLTNESAIFEELFNGAHVDEYERASHWKDDHEVRSRVTAEAIGSVSHSLPGVLKSYFFGWLGVIHDTWINICAVFTTVLMIGIVAATCLPAGVVRLMTAPSRVARFIRNRKKRTSAEGAELELPAPPSRASLTEPKVRFSRAKSVPPGRENTDEPGTSQSASNKRAEEPVDDEDSLVIDFGGGSEVRMPTGAVARARSSIRSLGPSKWTTLFP
jgi:hypothetical protein